MNQYLVEMLIDGNVRTSIVKGKSIQEVLNTLPHTVIRIQQMPKRC